MHFSTNEIMRNYIEIIWSYIGAIMKKYLSALNFDSKTQPGVSPSTHTKPYKAVSRLLKSPLLLFQRYKAENQPLKF